MTSVGVLNYTDTGYITNVRDVYLSLVHHFQRGEHRDRQLTGQNPIRAHRFFCYTSESNPVPRPVETFRTLDGINSQYQFVVSREGVMYVRMRPCWCLHCMVALTANTLEWTDESYDVPNCTTSPCICPSTSESCETTTNLYTFYRRECLKMSGPGAARQVQERVELRNEQASQLTVGDWVIFQGTKEESAEPIWLGRVMSNTEWGGQGVWKNDTKKQKKYPLGITVARNEVAIFVMWYEKIDINSDVLDYRISRDVTEPVVQNNRPLIHASFKMHRMNSTNNPVPRLRTSTRASRGALACAKRNNQTRHNAWHDKEFGLEWKMDKEDRELSLSRRST